MNEIKKLNLSLLSGLLILASCAFLTPHFAYIPTSALSAVIIAAMIFTIEVEILLPLWKAKSAYPKCKTMSIARF